MAAPVWRVEFDRAAARDLRKLGAGAERRVLRYLRERISGSEDPGRFGHALTADHKGFWRYRVGELPGRGAVERCWAWLFLLSERSDNAMARRYMFHCGP